MSAKETQKASQIDYILVSGRWKSAVQSSYVRWGPSVHRFGWRYDHAMLCSTLKFKVRKIDKAPDTPDWEELRVEKARNEFEAAYVRAKEKLTARRAAATAAAEAEVESLGCEELLADLNEAMRESKETLPARKKGKRERRRSDRTQKLHKKREVALQRLTRGSPAWREAR